MVNPEKLCRCGHRKQQHRGGRGNCMSIIDGGYHSPTCRCSVFIARTAEYERLQKMGTALEVALDMLERRPGGNWPLLTPDEQRALVDQIRAALGMKGVGYHEEVKS
jgi:hypothetical protein